MGVRPTPSGHPLGRPDLPARPGKSPSARKPSLNTPHTYWPLPPWHLKLHPFPHVACDTIGVGVGVRPMCACVAAQCLGVPSV